MKIKFTKDFEAEITVDIIDDEPEIVMEVFRAGEEHDVELLSKHEPHINVQFGDGSCCYGIPTEVIEIIEED